MNFRQKFNRERSKAFLIAMYLHLPVFSALAYYNGQSQWVAPVDSIRPHDFLFHQIWQFPFTEYARSHRDVLFRNSHSPW